MSCEVWWENSYHHLTMGFLTARALHATQSGPRTCSLHAFYTGDELLSMYYEDDGPVQHE